MAIQYNENIKIAAPSPLDKRYLSERTLVGSPLPYSGVTEVNTAIISTERYTGLTVNIVGVEYWYKEGVTDGDLIEKKYDSIIPSGDFVTGATNLGYFSGKTGIQILPIDNLSDSDYDGNYNSLYNYYFRGDDGKIHVGKSSDNISRRGYYNTSINKSWLWNEYLGDATIGWIFVDGNIENQIGQVLSVYGGASYTPQYSGDSWTTGDAYNNTSDVVISTVTGSLTTGTTLTIGGPVYVNKIDNVLGLRTLKSQTTDLIKISSDESFVYLSGSSGNQLITASNGLTKVGQNVVLGGTISATTTITDSRVTPVGIEYGSNYSVSFTQRSLVDKEYVDSRSSASGERIVKTIYQPSHGFIINDVVGWSGGTYNKPIANGTYDGEVLGIVSRCIDANCFDITQAGYTSGLTASLITNCTYFLSATDKGCLTTTEPSTDNYISKAMLIATSTNSGWVLPYAAYTISSGITEGGPLIKSVCLPSSPYPMTPTDYFVGVAGGSIVMLPSTPKLGMVAIIGDISGTAFSSPITVFGTIIGPQSSATINTDNGSLTFIWNGSTWSVIGFAPAAY